MSLSTQHVRRRLRKCTEVQTIFLLQTISLVLLILQRHLANKQVMLWTFVVVVTLFLSSGHLAQAWINCSYVQNSLELAYCRCPFRDDDPCECTIVDNSSYTVACYQAHGDQLLQMMDKVREAALAVHTLFINGCNVTLPRTDVFKSLPFTTVHFVRSRVDPPESRSPDSFQPILAGLEKSVVQVNFRDTSVVGVDSNNCALGSLNQLRRLSITGAGLTRIPDDFFCCSYLNLEEVYLFQNNIQSMRSGGLSRAENIKVFNANNNQITVVDRQFFHEPALKLEEIHLRYNKIPSLPRDMFSGLPSLRVVDLSHNNIINLPANIWSNLWSTLPDIYLDGNQLPCECGLDWLVKIEQGLKDKQRWGRFLTGTCTSPKNQSEVSPLDHLDFTDIICN